MQRETAFNVATDLIAIGFEVDLHGRSQLPDFLDPTGGWTMEVGHRSQLRSEDIVQLLDMLDAVGLMAYLNPTGGGFWVQEKR